MRGAGAYINIQEHEHEMSWAVKIQEHKTNESYHEDAGKNDSEQG